MSKRNEAMPQPEAGGPRRRSRRQADQASFPTLEPFARRLEKLRFERGFTQRALAKRAGISTNHYQHIANAHANPTATVVLSLADALGASVVELFESPAVPSDERRLIFAKDLRDLAAAHRRLTDIVARIAKDDMSRASRQRTRRA